MRAVALGRREEWAVGDIAVPGIAACLGAVGLASSAEEQQGCVCWVCMCPGVGPDLCGSDATRQKQQKVCLGNRPKSLPRKNEIAGHTAMGFRAAAAQWHRGLPLGPPRPDCLLCSGDCWWGQGRGKEYGRCWRAGSDFFQWEFLLPLIAMHNWYEFMNTVNLFSKRLAN